MIGHVDGEKEKAPKRRLEEKRREEKKRKAKKRRKATKFEQKSSHEDETIGERRVRVQEEDAMLKIQRKDRSTERQTDQQEQEREDGAENATNERAPALNVDSCHGFHGVAHSMLD